MLCPTCKVKLKKQKLGWFRSEAKPKLFKCSSCGREYYSWPLTPLIEVSAYEQHRRQHYDPHG